jgi:hypothetical protein
MLPLGEQVIWLLVLALPTACIAWTVTHEELFREPREWLAERSRRSRYWYQRKLCYVWTCEYCFSHYVAAAVIAVVDFPLLLPDWRGYLLAWFSLVAVANVFMSAYGRLRVEIRKEKTSLELARKESGPLSDGSGTKGRIAAQSVS